MNSHRLEHRKDQMRRHLQVRDLPDCLWEMNCRLVLEAYHGGKWRMLFALTKETLKSVWNRRGWRKWEQFRTKVLRRPQDEALAGYSRVSEEMDAVEEMAGQL